MIITNTNQHTYDKSESKRAACVYFCVFTHTLASSLALSH